jgi:ribokinase
VESRVIVFGSLNLDVVYTVARLPEPGETVRGTGLRRFSGGKGGNQAYAAARVAGQDVRVAMVACVGADEAGVRVRSDLEAAGVDTTFVRTVEQEATGTAFIGVDEAGENSIVVVAGANGAWPDDLVPSAPLDAGDVVVCQLEVPLEVVARVVDHAAAAGARVVLNAAPVDPAVRPLLDRVDVLVVNALEAAEILDLDRVDAGTISEVSRDAGPALVVTLGADGALVADADGVRAVPPFAVDAIDTVGAGDAFVGALAAELAAGVPLATAARTGNAAGALTATVAGARHPLLTKADIDVLRTRADAP